MHECATVATVVGSHLVDPANMLNAAPVGADRGRQPTYEQTTNRLILDTHFQQ